MTIQLDIFLSALLGIAALGLGAFLNKTIPFLRRICIPAPVSGGLALALLTLLCHSLLGIDLAFDTTLKDVSMVLFFTTVGFLSDLTVLKRGGRPLVIMVVLIAALICLQNLVGLFTAKLLGENPLVGMAAGSVTMAGGHGTAGGFSALFAEKGLESAQTVLMASATFGLLAGSLIGGPLAEMLIRRRSLDTSSCESSPGDDSKTSIMNDAGPGTGILKGPTASVCLILLSAGLGSLLNKLLSLTALSFPTYFGSLIVAAVIRNISELVQGCPKLPMADITKAGSINLSLFLGMSMVSLRLWELADLALVLLVILLVQVIVLVLFVTTFAFPLLGKDYDAALLVSGICGFALGATPNAMANMSAVCSKYHYSVVPFLIVPVVGAIFVDLLNIAFITLFLNVL